MYGLEIISYPVEFLQLRRAQGGFHIFSILWTFHFVVQGTRCVSVHDDVVPTSGEQQPTYSTSCYICTYICVSNPPSLHFFFYLCLFPLSWPFFLYVSLLLFLHILPSSSTMLLFFLIYRWWKIFWLPCTGKKKFAGSSKYAATNSFQSFQ